MTQTEEPKMLGSGVFSEKRATHTFTSCHEVFHPTGIWQLSQYCLKNSFKWHKRQVFRTGARWRGGDTEVVQLWGTELTFWTTPFKASFNHHHNLESLYNMFSALMALELAITGNGWGQSSAAQTFSNRLLQNLQNEPLFELQSNLTWMMLKMLRTKTRERNSHPWMHTLETEA